MLVSRCPGPCSPWPLILCFPGAVVLLAPPPADGPADPRQLLPDGRAASPTSSFTQQDVNDGLVWYRHSGAAESDSFQLQVLPARGGSRSGSAGVFLWRVSRRVQRPTLAVTGTRWPLTFCQRDRVVLWGHPTEALGVALGGEIGAAMQVFLLANP